VNASNKFFKGLKSAQAKPNLETGRCAKCKEHAEFSEELSTDIDGQETFNVVSNCCSASEWTVDEDSHKY